MFNKPFLQGFLTVSAVDNYDPPVFLRTFFVQNGMAE